MKEIEIKRVAVNDVAALQRIGTLCFLQTFSAYNSAGNMEKYLKDSFATDKLVSQIDSEGSLFYFALLDEEPIGYLKLNTGSLQTELQDNNALEIERIYVLADYHGKGVGQLLYKLAIEIAEARKSAYVWLGVWEHNHRAINFYQKNGFQEFNKHLFKLGDEEQTDIMMRKIL